MNASSDDESNATFANKFSIMTVGLEFRKAPLAKFPEPLSDIVAIIKAVLTDPSLPVDQSRVVLRGFSGGGCLALCAAQVPELREKLKGMLIFYPPTDATLKMEERLNSRPYRNAKDTEELSGFAKVVNWSYLRPGQRLDSPMISPRFARREDLPKWIYTIGAEYDQLCYEAKRMMFALARLSKEEEEEGNYGFEKGTLKWTLVKDVRHGFSHPSLDMSPVDEKVVHAKRMEEVMEQIGTWLFNGPFAV